MIGEISNQLQNGLDANHSPLGEKACTKCRKVKTLGDFPGNRTKRDGRDSECRACKSLRCAAKRAAKRTKVCSSCRDRKLLAQFNRNREKSDGYDNRCKECRKAGDKVRVGYAAERMLERKAISRRQWLFTVTPQRRSTTKPPEKIDIRFWNRISDPAERDKAHRQYLRLLAPPQCGEYGCVCGKCIGEPFRGSTRVPRS
jgi:hypothetical protein